MLQYGTSGGVTVQIDADDTGPVWDHQQKSRDECEMMAKDARGLEEYVIYMCNRP